jgi:SAM-dependent methyltransferase
VIAAVTSAVDNGCVTTSRDWDEAANRSGIQAVADGEPTRWFEEIWSAGVRDEIDMPWDRRAPNPLIVDRVGALAGRRAVVIGAGLGADAEFLAGRGYETVAFDIAESAVSAARQRYPRSSVDYRTANLLHLPAELVGVFDLVVEVYTVQALPQSVRPQAVAGVRRLLAPGGVIIAVQMVRETGELVTPHPPWLLDRAEMESFAADDVAMVDLSTAPPTKPGGRGYWVAELRRRG